MNCSNNVFFLFEVCNRQYDIFGWAKPLLFDQYGSIDNSEDIYIIETK